VTRATATRTTRRTRSRSRQDLGQQPRDARVELAAGLGVPNPEMAVRGNGAAMVVGGAALVLGKAPRLAALGLIGSLIPTTLAGHPFWEKEGAERKQQEVQFYKNLGLLGGLLLALQGKGR
jgi:uncharacterized membrane protein YphA (DoxX/SURF4 family)